MSGSVVDLIDRPARATPSEALVSEASRLVELVELLEELLSLDHSSFGTESEASNALLDLRAKLSEQAEIVNRLRREELHFAFWGNDEEKALREAELWERVLASFSPSGGRPEEELVSSSSQETRRVARKSVPATVPPTLNQSPHPRPSSKRDPKPSSSAAAKSSFLYERGEGASDLDKLNNLREQGFLDDEELVLAKAKLLEENEQQDQQQTLGKMLLEEEQRKDTATPMHPRMRCKYGSACYRKNPQHFVDFAHPDDPDWEGAVTREGNSLWNDMKAAEAHAEALNKSINAALDRSEVQVIAFCCFEYRALAGKLKRPGSCRFGDQCKYLHANPAHIDSLISRYGMVCDREHEHGTCRHQARRDHP